MYTTKGSITIQATLLSRAFQKKLNQELTQHSYKITAEHISVLVQVWEQNGQSQWELAQKLFKDKTTMAHLAVGLESQKLILRKKNSLDGREKIIYITKRGESVIHGVIILAEKIFQQLRRGITEQEMEICNKVLHKAHENLIK